MVRNCTAFNRSAANATARAAGRYSVSHKRSRSSTWRRALCNAPGAGICTSSCARNTTVPKTRRIGCEKLPAVYWVAGLGSGKPQTQAGGGPPPGGGGGGGGAAGGG